MKEENNLRIKTSKKQDKDNEVPSFARTPELQNALQRYEATATEYLPALAKDAIKYRVMELDQDNKVKEVYSFHPQHIGPFFAQDEKITGFRGLKAEVWLTPILSEAYLKVQYQDSANPELLHIIYREIYGFTGPRLIEDEQDFIKKLKEQEKLRDLETPFTGEKIVDTADLEIYLIANREHREWFERHSAPLQSLMMATVDNISPLDTNQIYWSYYLLFAKLEKKRILAGFGTAYQFHRDALRYRARISQVMILPEFRSKGMGRILLQSLYTYHQDDENCFDITVEQANNEFHSFRDLTEVWLAISKAKGSLKEFVDGVKSGFTAKFEHYQSQWKKDWVLQIRQNVKIGLNRAERVAETVMMAGIDIKENSEFERWKTGVSERLARVNRDTLQPHRRAAKLIRAEKKQPMILFISGSENEAKLEEEMNVEEHDELALYKAEMMRAQADYKRALADMVQKEVEGYTHIRNKILGRLKK